MMHAKTIALATAIIVTVPLCARTLPTVGTPQVVAELGLTPTALVMVGAPIVVAEQILLRLHFESELRGMLALLHEEEKETSSEATSLYQQMLAGDVSQSVTDQYQALRTSLESVRSQLQQTQSALRTAALTGVSSTMASKLEIVINGLGHQVPSSFAADQRTDEEWRLVTIALRAEARAMRLEESCDPAYAQRLSQIRSDSDVIAAEQALTLYLAQMEQTFATFDTTSP